MCVIMPIKAEATHTLGTPISSPSLGDSRQGVYPLGQGLNVTQTTPEHTLFGFRSSCLDYMGLDFIIKKPVPICTFTQGEVRASDKPPTRRTLFLRTHMSPLA